MRDEKVFGSTTVSDIWNYFEEEYYSAKRTQKYYKVMEYYTIFTMIRDTGKSKLFQKKKTIVFFER